MSNTQHVGRPSREGSSFSLNKALPEEVDRVLILTQHAEYMGSSVKCGPLRPGQGSGSTAVAGAASYPQLELLWDAEDQRAVLVQKAAWHLCLAVWAFPCFPTLGLQAL